MDKISQAKREEIVDKVAIFLEKNYRAPVRMMTLTVWGACMKPKK